MAVTLDNSGRCSVDGSWTAGSSFTLTSYVASGTDTYMRVAVFQFGVSADNVSSVTWGGSGAGWGLLAFAASASPDGQSVYGCKGLTGTQNIVVTLTAFSALCNFVVDSWTGVDQTTPTGTTVTNTGTGTAMSANAGSVPSNGVVVGSSTHRYSFNTITTSNTALQLAGSGSVAKGRTLGSAYSTSTGTIAFTAGSSYGWACIATPLNAAGAGGGTFFNPITGRGGAAAQPLVH